MERYEPSAILPRGEQWVLGISGPNSFEAAFPIGYLEWRVGDSVADSRATLEAAIAAPAAASAGRVIGEGDWTPSGSSPRSPAAPAARVIAPPVEPPHGATLFGDLAGWARGSATSGGAPLDAAELEGVYGGLTRRLEAIRSRAAIRPGRRSAGIAGAGRQP